MNQIFKFIIFVLLTNSFSICYGQFILEYGKSSKDIIYDSANDRTTFNIGSLKSYGLGAKTKKNLFEDYKIAGTFRLNYGSNDDKTNINCNFYEGQVGLFYDPFNGLLITPVLELNSAYRIGNIENKLQQTNIRESGLIYSGQISLNKKFSKLNIGLAYKYLANSSNSVLPSNFDEYKLILLFPNN